MVASNRHSKKYLVGFSFILNAFNAILEKKTTIPLVFEMQNLNAT